MDKCQTTRVDGRTIDGTPCITISPWTVSASPFERSFRARLRHCYPECSMAGTCSRHVTEPANLDRQAALTRDNVLVLGPDNNTTNHHRVRTDPIRPSSARTNRGRKKRREVCMNLTSMGGCDVRRHEGGRYHLGIDIGGTFTDLTAVDTETGQRFAAKTPTVPSNPARGVANGLTLLTDQGIDIRQVGYFVHGTTIGLNTIIQRSAPPVALIVTEGFRDVLEIGRLRLPVPWNFYSRRPTPLISRNYVVEVKERILRNGEPLLDLTTTEMERVVQEVESLGVGGVAICLLHSYANPDHELALAQVLTMRWPALFVSCSAEIWPQMREYERALVTLMNTYIRPSMVRYLAGLDVALADAKVTAPPYLTRSNGGIMTAKTARDEPVHTLLSGPASGVLGAARAGIAAGFAHLITLDMGGTSADAAVVQSGNIDYGNEERIGDFPMILPAIGISSIGAGGGSIGWIDGAGVLRVGPHSAGADPGPACYASGGMQPTLTDAFLVCGYLDPEHFAGGRQLDAAAAHRSTEDLGRVLGMDTTAAADAMIRVALANMFMELTGVVERKGLDPRDFTLVAFGGAGPVVAALLAEEINIQRVLVPASPGTLCALGALEASVMSDFIRSVHWRLDMIDLERLHTVCRALHERAEMWLEREAPGGSQSELHWSADMRYSGQSYEIEVPLEDEWIASGNRRRVAAAFHTLYERLFAHSDPEAAVEVVAIRLRALRHVSPSHSEMGPRSSVERDRTVRRRPIVCRGQTRTANVYVRPNLDVGRTIEGPAVVEQMDSTCLVPPGWSVNVDDIGNLLLMRSREG